MKIPTNKQIEEQNWGPDLEAYFKKIMAEERERRRLMPWYARLWEDFSDWWRNEQAKPDHTEWLGPPKEPPGGGFG